MQNSEIRAFLIQFTTNLWSDPVDHLRLDERVLDAVLHALPNAGINTVIIDLGDAVQYSSHPELALKDSWTPEKLINKLDLMRAIGLTPIPKLNFSACHDGWLHEYSRMVSSASYYEVCLDLIAEACRMFAYPAYFHIGMDEEDFTNQADMDIAIIRGSALWWHDVNLFAHACREQGARAMMWADICLKRIEEVKRYMPSDMILCHWYYANIWNEEDELPPHKHWAGASDYYRSFLSADEIRDTEDGLLKAYFLKKAGLYKKIDALGFDQLPTGNSLGQEGNFESMLRLTPSMIRPEHLLGYIQTTWKWLTPENESAILSCLETTRRAFAARDFANV